MCVMASENGDAERWWKSRSTWTSAVIARPNARVQLRPDGGLRQPELRHRPGKEGWPARGRGTAPPTHRGGTRVRDRVPGVSLAQAHQAFDPSGQIANSALQGRLEETITCFL